MKTSKKVKLRSKLSGLAVDWIRQLGVESAAFKVAGVSEKTSAGEWFLVVTLSTIPDKGRVRLFVEQWVQVSPRTALAAFELQKSVPEGGRLMLCAPYISPRVAEMCRERDVCYLDAVGNCRIAAPGLFVSVSGRPNRPPPTKPAVDPFSTKSSRVVRAMLTHPEKGWQVQQLAQVADVSIGLVSKVKRALLEEAHIEQRDRLLFVRDPAKLLQDWQANYSPRAEHVSLFAIARPLELEKQLADWCRANEVAYALTQLCCAWRYSPMVRYDRSVVYIDQEIMANSRLAKLLKQIDAKEVDTGANCILWITDDPAVFVDSRPIDGVNIVSPLQLYLDLSAVPRGEEVAQEILKKEMPALVAKTNREPGDTSGAKHE